MKKNFLLMAMCMATLFVNAQTTTLPDLKLELFSSGYDSPVAIVNATFAYKPSWLYIVEKTGKIWICNSQGAKVKSTPFLDISDRVLSTGSEQGLLGLAFHPEYNVNGYFYVCYTGLGGNTVVSRFWTSIHFPTHADLSSERKLLQVADPYPNHNGGCMRIGYDGYLYIGLGDGGSAGDPQNRAQNINKLLGKMLRIDPSVADTGANYYIPASNPFVGMAGRPEIWATGLRNPWGFSFDRLNGNLWIADVGQDNWEEINFQPDVSPGGENYGWSCWEGSHFYKTNCNANNQPVTFPIVEYPHIVSPGGCTGSVTGGYVYRGTKYPNMYGKYFYADYCTGDISTVFKDNGVWVNHYLKTIDPATLTAFGENTKGELFVTNFQTGEIYHLVDDATPKLAEPVNETAENIALFPNPNNGDFSVQLNALQNENCIITISDYLGREVLTENKSLAEGFNEWRFSSDKFIKGMYMLHVKTSDGIISKRFSVQ